MRCWLQQLPFVQPGLARLRAGAGCVHHHVPRRLASNGSRNSSSRNSLSSAPSPARASNSLTAFAAGAVFASAVAYALSTRNLSPPSSKSLELRANMMAGASTPDSDSNYPQPLQRFNFAKEFSEAISELKNIFSAEQVTTDEDELALHGVSPNSHHKPANPACVFYPTCTQDVQKAVVIASRHRMPITPFSGGTSLEGHITAPHGGLCIDLSRMDKVIALHEGDSDIVVQSGITWQGVNEYLDEANLKHPLFFPLDPGPSATVGGLVSTGGSGTNAMRYGTARAEWILNLTVVMANGEIIKTRARSRKSSAGFDLTKMFIGAEGTLGVVTEATLRLTPKLPTRVAVCNFPQGIESAVAAAVEIITRGAPLQCAELVDTTSVMAINKSGTCPRQFKEADSLFFKFQGDSDMIQLASKTVAEIVKAHGGEDLMFASSQEESDDIWHGRKTLHWNIMALRPGAQAYSTDVCVPISQLPKLVKDTQEDLRQNGIFGPCLGHVGDGNFHTGMLFEGEEEFKKVHAAASRMVSRAQALEGTASGEHGIGVGKKQYLERELGRGTLEVMQAIKDLLDPHGIMNPGKLYPDLSPKEQK